MVVAAAASDHHHTFAFVEVSGDDHHHHLDPGDGSSAVDLSPPRCVDTAKRAVHIGLLLPRSARASLSIASSADDSVWMYDISPTPYGPDVSRVDLDGAVDDEPSELLFFDRGQGFMLSGHMKRKGVGVGGGRRSLLIGAIFWYL